MMNGKMLCLSHVDQYHFIHLLAMKHAGLLEQSFPSDEARERLIAKSMRIKSKTCGRLKQSLLAAKLITHEWEPLGEGEIWVGELPRGYERNIAMTVPRPDADQLPQEHQDGWNT